MGETYYQKYYREHKEAKLAYSREKYRNNAGFRERRREQSRKMNSRLHEERLPLLEEYSKDEYRADWKAEYAMYKGEDFITIGTLKEIAKEQNLSIASIYSWFSPSKYANRAIQKPRGFRIEFVKIDDDIEEDMEA